MVGTAVGSSSGAWHSRFHQRRLVREAECQQDEASEAQLSAVSASPKARALALLRLAGKRGWDDRDFWAGAMTAMVLGVDPTVKAMVSRGEWAGHHVDAISWTLVHGDAATCQAVWSSGWRPNAKQSIDLLGMGLFKANWGGALDAATARGIFVWVSHQAGEQRAWPFIDELVRAGRLGWPKKEGAGSWLLAAGSRLAGVAQRCAERLGEKKGAALVARLCLLALATRAEAFDGQEVDALTRLARAGGAQGLPPPDVLARAAAHAGADVAIARLAALARAGVALGLGQNPGLSQENDGRVKEGHGLVAVSLLGAPKDERAPPELLHPAWGQFLSCSADGKDGFLKVAKAISEKNAGVKLWPSWEALRGFVEDVLEHGRAQEAAAVFLGRALEEESWSPDGAELAGEKGLACLLSSARLGPAQSEGFEAFLTWAGARGRLSESWRAGRVRVGQELIDAEATLSDMSKKWPSGFAMVEAAHLEAVGGGHKGEVSKKARRAL